MNFSLYKSQLKSNNGVFLGVFGISIFYIAMLILAYSLLPDVANAMDGEMGAMMREMLSQGALTFMGMGFFGNIYYFAFVLFLVLKLATKYGSTAATNTTMSCYLSAPISRTTYISTTAMTILTTTFVYLLGLYIVGNIAFAIGGYEVNQLDFIVSMGARTYSLFALAAIGFFFSFAFAGSKNASMLAIIIPIFIMMIPSLLSTISADVEWFKWGNPLEWINLENLVKGNFDWLWLATLGYTAIIAVSFIGAWRLFKRRNISI
ncbi:MAG: hypothetical protein LBM01_00685 [Christensenellaceae bacterium]|jgi:hypothetical protein|nr:hypothetical protein [Christensenellaceae bacterium]